MLFRVATALLAASAVASAGETPSAESLGLEQENALAGAALAADDACLAAGSDNEQCSLNALQRRAQKVASADMEDDAKAMEEAMEMREAMEEADAQAMEEAQLIHDGAAEARDMAAMMEEDEQLSEERAQRHQAAMKASGLSWAGELPVPAGPMTYNGKAYPELIVADNSTETHIFAIGDWGGMDGSFQPDEGRHRIYMYHGGKEPGPHIMARGRPDCSGVTMGHCMDGRKQCPRKCGFVYGVDDQAQLLVADAMQKRAAKNDPKYFLNVGDNFYWGGIEKTCGSPMSKIDWVTKHQFDTIFEEVYKGPGIDGKPWLSVLGNHDWGGRQFNNGWDQQVAYTWNSPRWVMPAIYWSQKVTYPTFDVEYYMLDTNFQDAMEPHVRPATNICSGQWNRHDASCSKAGGPPSISGCQGWFQRLWQEQKKWLPEKLAASTADWQVAVTHFPCGYDGRFWRQMHDDHGLDLLVTGHRHEQEFWKAGGNLGGLTCFVTGGGGGITSEESIIPGAPSHNQPWKSKTQTGYGFFDLSISKDKMVIESINYDGKVLDSTTIHPK